MVARTGGQNPSQMRGTSHFHHFADREGGDGGINGTALGQGTNRMASAAPKRVPAEAPRMMGETRGLRNTPRWQGPERAMMMLVYLPGP